MASIADVNDNEMTPEEEKLWMMDDEELEKQVIEEKNASADNEDSEDDMEQSTDDEEETEDSLDGDEDSESDSEDNEDSNIANDANENEDSEEDSEEQPEDSESEKPKSFKPVRANGMDIPVNSLDEVYQMASMGYNYKKKMADIAPYRRAVSAMKEHGLTDIDIALLVDIKKGDKGAIAKVMRDSEVDPLDFDTSEHEYQAKIYGDDEQVSALKEIEKEISSDPEYAKTVNVVNKLWDIESQKILSGRPELIKGLHQDIKDGIYEKVAPEAARLEFLDSGSKSKLEYYVEAAQAIAKKEQAKQKVLSERQVLQERQVSQKRKAAATTKSKATGESRKEVDWINMSDEDYDKFYKETMMT